MFPCFVHVLRTHLYAYHQNDTKVIIHLLSSNWNGDVEMLDQPEIDLKTSKLRLLSWIHYDESSSSELCLEGLGISFPALRRSQSRSRKELQKTKYTELDFDLLGIRCIWQITLTRIFRKISLESSQCSGNLLGSLIWMHNSQQKILLCKP